MTKTNPAKTALLVIDVQKGLDDPKLGNRNNPQAEKNISRLLDFWRTSGQPVIHVQHDSVEKDSPLRPGLPGHAFKDEALPLTDEIRFSKSVNSAFIGTGLEDYLKQHLIFDLVIIGLTTDHCVSTSTRMAANLGFNVTLVSDATAAHEKKGFNGKHYSADDIHMINLVSLDGEFCQVQSTDQVLRPV